MKRYGLQVTNAQIVEYSGNNDMASDEDGHIYIVHAPDNRYGSLGIDYRRSDVGV